MGFYVTVVSAASGVAHLREQLTLGGPWIATIVAGIAVQTRLLLTLREPHRARAAAVPASTGAAAAVVEMLARCPEPRSRRWPT